MVIMVQILVKLSSLHKMLPFKDITFLSRNKNEFPSFSVAILDFGGHLELPKDARLASIRF